VIRWAYNLRFAVGAALLVLWGSSLHAEETERGSVGEAPPYLRCAEHEVEVRGGAERKPSGESWEPQYLRQFANTCSVVASINAKIHVYSLNRSQAMRLFAAEIPCLAASNWYKVSLSNPGLIEIDVSSPFRRQTQMEAIAECNKKGVALALGRKAPTINTREVPFYRKPWETIGGCPGFCERLDSVRSSGGASALTFTCVDHLGRFFHTVTALDWICPDSCPPLEVKFVDPMSPEQIQRVTVGKTGEFQYQGLTCEWVGFYDIIP